VATAGIGAGIFAAIIASESVKANALCSTRAVVAIRIGTDSVLGAVVDAL